MDYSELYIIDTPNRYLLNTKQDSGSGIDLLILMPLVVYGTYSFFPCEKCEERSVYLKTKSREVYDYVSNLWNITYAWMTGIRRFNKDDVEIYEPLNEECGKKYLNYDGKQVIAEGYYNDDVLFGPGKIRYESEDKEINTKGIYKNNKLNGPGTFVIEQWNCDECNNEICDWINGTYTGIFRDNNLHGKGKFENDYISVEGEFKNGYIQEGTIIVKEFNPCYMDMGYKNRKRITGKFSGNDYFSQTAFVDYFPLETPIGEQNEIELVKGRFKVIEKGSFKNGRLHGISEIKLEVNDRIYLIKGRYYNGQLMKHCNFSIKNNDIELKKTEIEECSVFRSVFEFIYSNGNRMEVDKDVTEFKITFGSHDIVKGDIRNNTLIKEQISISKYPIGEFNSDEIEIMLPNVTDLVYKKHKERSIADLNKLEFSYWLSSKNRDIYDILSLTNSDINGEIFMSIKTINEYKYLTNDHLDVIIELQKDIEEDSEESDDSIVIVSPAEESSVEEE